MYNGLGDSRFLPSTTVNKSKKVSTTERLNQMKIKKFKITKQKRNKLQIYILLFSYIFTENCGYNSITIWD